jgi:hypothetical protein
MLLQEPNPSTNPKLVLGRKAAHPKGVKNGLETLDQTNVAVSPEKLNHERHQFHQLPHGSINRVEAVATPFDLKTHRQEAW